MRSSINGVVGAILSPSRFSNIDNYNYVDEEKLKLNRTGELITPFA